MDLPVNTFKRAIRAAGSGADGLWCSLSQPLSRPRWWQARVSTGCCSTPSIRPTNCRWSCRNCRRPRRTVASDRAACRGTTWSHQALPRRRRADAADPVRADRRRGAQRRRLHALSAARACAVSAGPPARRGSAASRITPGARRRRFACWSRWRTRRAWTIWKRSSPWTASTACSSGPRTCMHGSGIPARPIIRTCAGHRRRHPAGTPNREGAGILTARRSRSRAWLECGALFVAVGVDLGLLARETEKLAAKVQAMGTRALASSTPARSRRTRRCWRSRSCSPADKDGVGAAGFLRRTVPRRVSLARANCACTSTQLV